MTLGGLCLKLTMATSLLELVVNRLRLILGDIVENVQKLFLFLAQAGVELM